MRAGLPRRPRRARYKRGSVLRWIESPTMTKKRATPTNGNGRQEMTTQKTARRQASGLTPRQARFVKEYLVDLNGTQAAIRAQTLAPWK